MLAAAWAASPTLHTPSLLAFIDELLGGIETVNGNGTETVTDKFFGIPLFVSTYNLEKLLEKRNLNPDRPT